MQQIVDFILELDKLKGVARKVRPIGLDRYENPAEHSWRIAPMAASLAQYAESPIDISRAIAMLLVWALVGQGTETGAMDPFELLATF